MNLETALQIVKANGYRVSKLKIEPARVPWETSRTLNAVGKPYGENYDPNYKMRYKPRKYPPAQSPEFSQHLTK